MGSFLYVERGGGGSVPSPRRRQTAAGLGLAAAPLAHGAPCAVSARLLVGARGCELEGASLTEVDQHEVQKVQGRLREVLV